MDRHALRDVAMLFLRLGFTAFGGPTVHIAMMQQEVVEKKKWLDQQRFLDLVGGVNLIPGPNSTELAIHIGHERAGWKGLIAAGLCFILPAVFITGVFAWMYKEYGALPQVQPFVYGIKPAIIGVILSAAWPLARKSVRTVGLVFIGIAVLLLALVGVNEILLLFGAGAVMAMANFFQGDKSLKSFYPWFLVTTLPAVARGDNLRLFLIFLKIGAILYGSGYVLFAFLDTELVARGLITRQQLIDAVAVGQFTPGPVFSSVTFIGYQINGWQGAAISTLGIFLPSFALVAILNPLVKALRKSPSMSAFLDAVNVASVALIIAVCFAMSKDSVNDWRAGLIALASIVIAFVFPKVNSALIIIGGAVSGYLLCTFAG